MNGAGLTASVRGTPAEASTSRKAQVTVAARVAIASGPWMGM
jgi:hypothetical protein